MSIFLAPNRAPGAVRRDGKTNLGGFGCSDLASEILADLKTQFPEGATLRMLIDWLAEPTDKLKGAIAELKARGLAHSSATRIHAGPHPSRGQVRGT